MSNTTAAIESSRWARRVLLSASLSLLLVAPMLAQDRAWVCDSSLDAVFAFVDIDANGTIDPLTEVTTFYDDSSPGPDLSTPNHLLPYADGILLSDGGTNDAIFFLADLNGDGDANDDGEVIAFYDDSSPGLDLGTANGMALAADGSVFVSDDGSGVRAVLRLHDLNGDGTANDDGESIVFYDASALSPAVVASDPESVAVGTNGVVYIGDSTAGAIYRLEDLDGNGDALGVDEATVFYEGASPAPLTDIESLQVDASGALYVIDEDTGTTMRLIDGNDDRDALDAGEAAVVYDGTTITDANDAILLADGRLLYADGALDALYLANDVDGDGLWTDGELTAFFDDASVLLSTPSGVAFVAGAAPPVPPSIDGVSPIAGPIEGGTSVTIVGGEFASATAVRFGDVDSSSFEVVSPEQIVAIAPASAATGLVDITVETDGGTALAAGAFRYQIPFVRGDADQSGVVDIGDAVAILAYLYLASEPNCLSSCDANDDAIVDVADPAVVLGYLFEFQAPMPPPFPDSGYDPTPSDPGCTSY